MRHFLQRQTDLRLHLGSGRDYWNGYINIDANPRISADLFLRVESLDVIPDEVITVIECNHLFEHLTLPQARQALAEWYRVLKTGGELHIEMPNLAVCIDEIGKHYDHLGCDLAMAGIYGYPPDVEADGLWQLHRWGWSPDTLCPELEAVGFYAVTERPIRQTWRHAASFSRDMHICAIKPTPL